jgi:hypothetical protein
LQAAAATGAVHGRARFPEHSSDSAARASRSAGDDSDTSV